MEKPELQLNKTVIFASIAGLSKFESCVCLISCILLIATDMKIVHLFTLLSLLLFVPDDEDRPYQ